MLAKRDIPFIKKDPATAKTQLVIVVGLAVLGLLFNNHALLLISVSVGLISIFIPFLGFWLVWFWYKIAEILSKITTPIILTILFYLFITPFSWLYKLFGNKPLVLKKPENSMFVKRDYTYSKKDMENPW